MTCSRVGSRYPMRTGMGGGLAIWDRREGVYGRYWGEIANLGIPLAEHTARALQAVDLVLRETQNEVVAEGINDAQEFQQTLAGEKMHQFLSRHSKNLPQSDAIGLVGIDGHLVNGSRYWPTPSLDVTDRDWYQYLRDHDDPGVFVSRPVLGKVT